LPVADGLLLPTYWLRAEFTWAVIERSGSSMFETVQCQLEHAATEIVAQQDHPLIVCIG
jgi:hypothetical protein